VKNEIQIIYEKMNILIYSRNDKKMYSTQMKIWTEIFFVCLKINFFIWYPNVRPSVLRYLGLTLVKVAS